MSSSYSPVTQGTAYAARGSVHNAAGVTRTRRMLRKAFETQLRGEGFSFVEVLTMCPTGWFIPTAEGPGYLDGVLGSIHVTGELKAEGKLRSTAELARQAEAAKPPEEPRAKPPEEPKGA